MRSTVTRLLVGGFQLPESVAAGERVVVNAWVVRHPEATVLVDTGPAEHLPPEDMAEMRFTRTPITEALAGTGLSPHASGFARALTAYRLAQEGYPDPPPYPDWLPRVLALEPYRVAFGHDTAVWQPDA